MDENLRQNTLLLFVVLILLNSKVRYLFFKSEEKNYYFYFVEVLQHKYIQQGGLFVGVVIPSAFFTKICKLHDQFTAFGN